jgi:hypothetical protein
VSTESSDVGNSGAEDARVPFERILAFIRALNYPEQEVFVVAAMEQDIRMTLDAECIAFINDHLRKHHLLERVDEALHPKNSQVARATARAARAMARSARAASSDDPCPKIFR